jgi:hypothetical protein
MNAEWFWVGSAVACTGFMGATALVLSKLRAPATPSTEKANERVSSGYYKPMARLLAEDLKSLESAGFTPRQIRQLRASRRRAFRTYLSDLQSDFRALHGEARLMARDAAADQTDLPVELVKVAVAFHYSVLRAHTQLAAHSVGLRAPDAARLLQPAEWMRQHAELLRMPAAESGSLSA